MPEKQTQQLTEAERMQYEALLARLDRFADVMDSRFQVPGTGLRFGLDGLIGLLPVAGDAITTLLGLYMLGEAMKIGAPPSILRRITGNIALDFLDFLVGLVPVAGDALDFAFKGHKRNAALLRDYATAQVAPPVAEERKRSPLLVWVMAAMGLVLLILVIIAV